MRLTLTRLAAVGALLASVQGCAHSLGGQTAYTRQAPVPPSQKMCADEADKPVFDVASLRSEMMVLALNCPPSGREQYNAFVTRHQAELRANEAALNRYFSRVYGRNAQKQHDDFITQLANVQSDDSVREGSLFCRGTLPVAENAVSVPTGGANLASFAAAQPIPRSVALVSCRSTGATPVRGRVVAPRHHTTHS